MSSSLRAVCTDFYVNQKVSVKLDLPTGRETVLELFERVRKQHGEMSQFRRYREELALETAPGASLNQWLAIRANTIRSGVVNPGMLDEAYTLHRDVLEVTPYFLSISPLDVDYIELLYGFDLAASGNHDAIVYRALWEGTPLGALLDADDDSGVIGRPIDCQPMLGMAIGDTSEHIQAHFEIKTRSGGVDRGRAGEGETGATEPISVYLSVRLYGPVGDLKAMPGMLDRLIADGEALVENRVVPSLVAPIREAILSGGG